MSKATEIINIVERMQNLNEFATLASRSKGYEFDVYIYSNDHYPPHIHIMQGNEKLGRLVIMKFEDENKFTLDDIHFLREANDSKVKVDLSNSMKKKMFNLMKSKNKRGTSMIRLAQDIWDALNQNLLIEDFDYSTLDQYII